MTVIRGHQVDLPRRPLVRQNRRNDPEDRGGERPSGGRPIERRIWAK